MIRPRLAIITTRLPPAICGIGTYSWRLREHWPNEQSIVEFLVLEGEQKATPLNDSVTSFRGRAGELSRALDRVGESDVLLHYAGRAYQRFGLPFWMPGVIAKWKRKFPRARLGIFFHELPGRFPLTSHHHWLGTASTRIIRRLAACADLVITNTENHLAQLRGLSGRSDIHLLPIGSNIETAPPSPEPRARTEFAVFGLPFGRWQTLQAFAPDIRRWRAEGRLTKLHLLGPNDDEFSKRADSLVESELVVRHGTLPSDQLAALLRRVGFALTNVSEETWSKSTTFMACAANECPVVVAGEGPKPVPLCYAVSASDVAQISGDELKTRAEALANWYRQSADWPVVARRLAALWPLAESHA